MSILRYRKALTFGWLRLVACLPKKITFLFHNTQDDPSFFDAILLDIRDQWQARKPIELMSARFYAVEQRGVKLEG